MSVRTLITVYFIFMITVLYAGGSDVLPLKKINWPFDGIFGKVDRQAAQRGFQIYKEVCSSCHGLHNLYYRNLQDLGFSAAEIKEIAKSYNVTDGPNDDGEMFIRSAIPSDRFVKPYPNEQAARSVNNGAYPVDLSLIVKARSGGGNYIYSLLVGYNSLKPTNMLPPEGLYYNPYFPNSQIAMPQPLFDEQVQYDDGTKASIEQMAYDVTVFLQWAAEPEMERRKSMGLKTVLFLIIFTSLFYIVKNKTWKTVN